MSRNRLEYHQGAIADAKSAVVWYKKRSPKAAADFIEELRQAAETILAMPDRWPPGKNNTRRFLLWRFLENFHWCLLPVRAKPAPFSAEQKPSALIDDLTG